MKQTESFLRTATLFLRIREYAFVNAINPSVVIRRAHGNAWIHVRWCFRLLSRSLAKTLHVRRVARRISTFRAIFCLREEECRWRTMQRPLSRSRRRDKIVRRIQSCKKQLRDTHRDLNRMHDVLALSRRQKRRSGYIKDRLVPTYTNPDGNSLDHKFRIICRLYNDAVISVNKPALSIARFVMGTHVVSETVTIDSRRDATPIPRINRV